MINRRKSLFRVTYFLQIRVGWILQISKKSWLFSFLDKMWTFWIVWYIVALKLFLKGEKSGWKIQKGTTQNMRLELEEA